MKKKEINIEAISFSHIFVSVIMPVYNTDSRYLISATDSILNQSHKNLELIIIDDCSTNLGTLYQLNIYSSNPRIKLIRNLVNLGISSSLNIGVEQARGKYIFRMDSDDISIKSRLLNSIKFMEANTDVDILGSNAITIGDKFLPLIMPKLHEDILFSTFFFCPMIHPTVVFRSATIRKYIPLYQNNAAEDYELWIRLQMLSNVKFMNLQRIQLLYRKHKSQITETKKNENLEVFLKFNKKLASHYNLNFMPSEIIDQLDTSKLKQILVSLNVSKDTYKQIIKPFIFLFIRRRIKRINLKFLLELKNLLQYYKSL
jgi:glycosyltransferase involved in cell wall biosynthesis